MSAAAMALPNTWERSGWTKTPRAFFKKLFRALTHVELGVLGNILDDSVGRSGEADWVEVKEPDLARLVNCHVNSVGAALDKLEQLSAIEARKSPRDKRVKQYRVLINNWAKITEREARKLERKGPASAGGAGTRDAIEPEPTREAAAVVSRGESKAALTVIKAKVPMVMLPGAKGAVPLAEACPHGAACELVRQFTTGANAGRTGTDAAKVSGEITTVDSGDSGSHLNGDFHRFEAFVAKALTKRLNAPPPRQLLEEMYRRLASERVPFETFVLRFGLRERAVKSYGFLRCIVDDCVTATNQARQLAGESKRMPTAEVQKVASAAREAAERLRRRGACEEEAKLLEDTARQAAAMATEPDRFELHLLNVDELLAKTGEERLTQAEKAQAEEEARDSWPNNPPMRQYALECAMRRMLIGVDSLTFGFQGAWR